MAGSPVEVELKLRLPPACAAAVAPHPRVRSPQRARARTEDLATPYFDTADGRLARDDIALRIRRVGRRFVQTLKGPATAAAGGGLAARAEHEWTLRSGSRRPPLDLA